MLKTIGKSFDGSGLYQSFIEERVYGPNTVAPIENGKHLKRSLALYATLYKKYLNELVDQNLIKKKRTSRRCSCCNNWPRRLSTGRES